MKKIFFKAFVARKPHRLYKTGNIEPLTGPWFLFFPGRGRLIQPSGFHSIHFGQIPVRHNFLPSQQIDLTNYIFAGDRRCFHWSTIDSMSLF